MFGNHARQTLIIRLLAGAVWTAQLAAPVSAAQHPALPSETGSCVSCLLLHISADDALALLVRSGALAGVTIVVDADAASAPAALDRLRLAGARAGLRLPVSASFAGLPGDPDLLVLHGAEAHQGGSYALRRMATAVRAARPGLAILLEGPPPPGADAYVDGAVVPVESLVAPDAEALVRASQGGSAAPALLHVRNVDWRAVAAFAARRALASEVIASVPLTVDEVIARHQAQRQRQERIVRRTIARGTTSLLFEAPGFAAPVTVTAETVIYRRPGVVEMEQRDVRINGAAVAGGGSAAPPRLPLVEPERVVTPPLAITLDDAYSYVLDGIEAVDGGRAYVVRFEGARARGRAWIDAVSFALRRIETIQTKLVGAIVSSEEHETFAPFAAGGETAWLPVRMRAFQVYEGAGHRTPIYRAIDIPDYDIDPDDFDAALSAAYASPHVMLRDTPEGFRYLLRARGAADGTGRDLVRRAGERLRTAVAGVVIDPNITVPLPFAGLGYVDLNVLDTGAQVSAFVGAGFGRVAWSIPSIAGSRWRMHGRAFAIAARYHDRVFQDGREQYSENITRRPVQASAGLARPFGPRARIRFDYELDYTAFGRAETTSDGFVLPSPAVVHGAVAAVEAEAGAWTLTAWWNPAVRQRWRPWGNPEGSRADPGAAERARAFQRMGARVARAATAGRLSARAELAWMSGVDLDRFSRYSFDAFENTLRGYPTASVQFDRGAVSRTTASWRARGWRIDGFADAALVRDPAEGRLLAGYPGIGAGFETTGPFQTLWTAEWGYGFRARRGEGGRGTQTVRLTAYRAF